MNWEKNLYRCKCGAQMVVSNAVGHTTPFMLKCKARSCAEFAQSTFYQIAQDCLGEPHLEIIHQGGTSGDNIVEVKQLRLVEAEARGK